ncbi:MAG: BON domain-containing protein [Pirellulales bacterium]|nr:BON domain-containing protein [Pirellulales bacterium]
MYRTLILALLCIVSSGNVASAQLFGARSLGNTLRRQPSPGAMADGTVNGNERFIRGARRRDDFVGADVLETPNFIGIQQGRSRGPIRSAIGNLPDRSDANVNRPQPSDAGGRARPYPPRLRVDFEVPPVAPAAASRALTARLEQSLGPRATGPLQVSLQGRVATLEGEVASAHDRDVAALWVLLAPGVDQVRNLLSVRPAEPLPPAGDGTRPNPEPDTGSSVPEDHSAPESGVSI